jgi:hypothetical protein
MPAGTGHQQVLSNDRPRNYSAQEIAELKSVSRLSFLKSVSPLSAHFLPSKIALPGMTAGGPFAEWQLLASTLRKKT